MNYKGIKLEDISGTPQVFIPPREMLVWDDGYDGKENTAVDPIKVTVLAIVNSDKLNGQVIAENTGFCRYGHCAEIPVEYATFRQIAQWIAEGNGEVTESCGADGAYCKSSLCYFSTNGDVSSKGRAMRIRKWDDTEWHEPTLEYMGLEG